MINRSIFSDTLIVLTNVSWAQFGYAEIRVIGNNNKIMLCYDKKSYQFLFNENADVMYVEYEIIFTAQTILNKKKK